MLLITVPEPCHEDWNKMAPNEKGAFCNACSKTVVDFTGMTDDEVRNYFIRNIGQKTCGHFRNDQLENTELAHILKKPISLWKKFVAAVLILFGSFLTGCKERTLGKLAFSDVKGVSLTVADNKTNYSDNVPKPEKPQKSEIVEMVCTVTNGDAAPVIMETTGTPDIIEEQPVEVLPVPMPLTVDSLRNIPPSKKECNDSDTATIYYQP